MTAKTVERTPEELAAWENELAEREAALEALTPAAPSVGDLEPEVVRWAERCGDEIGEDGRLTNDVQFRSRSRRLRVVVQPQRPQFDQYGQQRAAAPGIVAEFHEGLYTTTDPTIVWSLMTRSSFNREFFRVGMEPDAVPDSQPVLDKLMKATIELDVGTIEEIQAAERDGDKRPDVLAFCETALRKIHGEYEEHIPR